jgi:hypothetical protein
MLAFARLVRLVVGLIVLVVVAAIVLRHVSADAGNAILRDIRDAGSTLVGPFKNVFSIHNAKVARPVA